MNGTDKFHLCLRSFGYVTKIRGVLGGVVLAVVVFAAALGTALAAATKSELDGEGVVKIGAILPLSGDFACNGECVKKGLEMAVKKLREGNHRFKIEYADNKSAPTDGKEFYERLEGRGVKYFVVLHPRMALNIANYANGKDQIVFGLGVMDDNEAKNYNRFVKVTASTKDLIGEIAKYSRGNLKAENAAIVHVATPYGENSSNVFRGEFGWLGGKIVSEQKFDRGEGNFKSILKEIEDASPDVIFFAGAGDSHRGLIDGITLRLPNVPIVGDSSFNLPRARRSINPDANIYYSESAVSPEFLEQFRKEYKEEGSALSALAYAIPFLLCDAIQNSPDKNAPALLDHIRKTKQSPAFEVFEFLPSGELKTKIQVRKFSEKQGKAENQHTILNPSFHLYTENLHPVLANKK